MVAFHFQSSITDHGFLKSSLMSVFLLQVIHMQCNVEAVEEGAKYHVSH